MGMLYRDTVKLQKIWIYILLVAFMPAFCIAQNEQTTLTKENPVVETIDRRVMLMDVQGPIGPATAEFLIDSLARSSDLNAELVIIRMDTPGGLDASTRDIIKAILNSPVPVATFVTPGGARAASAGMYILIASHIAAMSPATNVGAATPVSIIGEAVAPSFGVLGIGGIISLVIGSVILIDTDVPGYMISRPLIGALALASSLGLMAIVGIAVKARLRPVVSGSEQMIGAMGTALMDIHHTGEVFVHSERWSAVSDSVTLPANPDRNCR